MQMSDRTILITGATSGIGYEMARQLLTRGNRIIITGRDQGRLDQACALLPGAVAICSDAADPAAIKALLGQVIERFPDLDTLINNAGIMRNIRLNEDRSLVDITREIDTNLSGPVRMVQQFLPHLLARPQALIVNVSSGLAFVPMPIAPIYSATKAGLHAYTLSLRVQLAGTRVKVVELAPPGTETPLFRGEFEDEVKEMKAMPVAVLVEKAIRGIEAGREEIRPGLSAILKLASRVAPQAMLKQLGKAGAPFA